MRNNRWLESRLELIQKEHFADARFCNNVTIKFGRRARTRLGSIRKQYGRSILNKLTNHYDSEILINGIFKNEELPEFLIDATIGHELCHYVHGFSSPLPQLSRYPHSGRLVDKEMINRGMGDMLLTQKKWLKNNWIRIIKENHL